MDQDEDFSKIEHSVHAWPSIFENFSKREKRVGYSISSTPYVIGGCEFHLRVYPWGDTIRNEEYVSIYLKMYQCTNPSIQFSMSIMDLNGNRILTQERGSRMYNYIKNELDWGRSTFEKCSFLAEKVLPVTGDQLIVLCEAFGLDDCETLYMRERLFSYGKFLNNKDYSDVKIVASGKTIYAHKVVLISGNEVFASILNHDCQESRENIIKIEDIEYNVMLELMRFIYTGQVRNIEKVVKKLLIAADKYGIEALKSKCEKFLCRAICTHDVLDSMILANCYRLNNLEKAALNFFTIHSKDIVKSHDFVNKLEGVDVNLIAKIITSMSELLEESTDLDS
ncbi:hypothetical protein QAD02_019069 [Eretmocerus hayati]|uniref:Uncharacterized protein n=1 Tax=Eretmocerus hayati TaxID=131215 RepID=A0ACC2PLN0_9HYME|nr:hypothetical protein QAD02_019069 [Eretmocerus hayati]